MFLEKRCCKWHILSSVRRPLKSAWVIMEHLRFGWMKVPRGKWQKWQFLWFGGFGPLWTCRNWRFSLCINDSRFMSSNVNRNQSLIKRITNSFVLKLCLRNELWQGTAFKNIMIYFIWRLFSICFWKIEEWKELTDVTLADRDHKTSNPANK